MPHNNYWKNIYALCYKHPMVIKLCTMFRFSIFGKSPEQVRQEWIPILLTTNPGGTSLKTIVHLLQVYKEKGRFQYFNYGTKGNVERYDSGKPPLYSLSNVLVPVYVMYGSKDALATKPVSIGRYKFKAI